MSENTTLKYWYEVAIVWDDDNGTETIASFDNLDDAKAFIHNDKRIKSEIENYTWNYIESIFIDKWIGDDILAPYKDKKFKTINRRIKKFKTKAVICWYAEDIKTRCGDEELNEKQIQDVLYLIENDHDACIGVNWDVIDFYISKVTKDHKK
tara:strand:- start:368 stop:823 length:456 start_codon:yes stop_codon:yes gene_type:complete